MVLTLFDKNLVMRSLFYLTLIALTTAASGQTNVQGGIYSNTTWSLSNSPYIMTGSIVVFPGKTLTIQPGVVVKVQNPGAGSMLYLEIRGNLVAQGTKNQPIVFESVLADTNYTWSGILVKGTQGGTISLNACHIKNAYYALQNDQVDSTKHSWKHMVFANNYSGLTYQSTFAIDSSLFENNEFGLSITHFSATDTNVISRTRFLRNGIASSGYYSATEFLECEFDSNVYGYFAANPFVLNYVGFDSCSFDGNFRAMEGPAGAWIRNCSFTQNQWGISQSNSCQIENCTFRLNDWAAEIYNSSIFVNNLLENNDNGLTVARSAAWGTAGGVPVVEDNRLCNNTIYNVLNGNDFNLELEKNCFCLSDSAAIEAKIYDGYDDITRGLLNFAVYDTSCTTQLFRVLKVNLLGNDDWQSAEVCTFPNPIHDLLTIQGLAIDSEIRIWSSLGVLRVNMTAKQSAVSINTADWPSGTYILQAGLDEPARTKIVKP